MSMTEGYAVSQSQFWVTPLSAGVKPSYLQYGFWAQFVGRLVNSSWSIASSFGMTVGIVLGFCSKEKMLWIDAGTIVAAMKNTQTAWNTSKHELNHEAVRFFVLAVNLKHAVAAALSAFPCPTTRTLFDAPKKSLGCTQLHSERLA